jgi:flagellum-specific ATP synthase
MNNKGLDFRPIIKEFESSTPYQNIGKILSSHGMIYEATLPRAVMGCCVEFVTQNGERCLGEVVGIDGHKCKVMTYEDITGSLFKRFNNDYKNKSWDAWQSC